MSYERTWSFSLNNAPTSNGTVLAVGQSFHLQLKQFLVTNGWTVVYSSNSSVANTSDNWNSTSDIVFASAGIAHSHITLRSPTGIIAGADGSYSGTQSCIWLTIDVNATNYNGPTIKMHNALPTGGSTTAVQTSTNQTGPTATQLHRSTWTPGAYFHFAINTTGMFWYGISYSSSTRLSSFFMLGSTSSPAKNPNGIDYPYGCFIYQPAFNDSGTGPNGLTFSGLLYSWTPYGASSSSTSLFAIATIANGSNVLLPRNRESWSGKYFTSPVFITCLDSNSYVYFLGRVPDVFISNITPQGVDSLGSPAWLTTGTLAVPYNANIYW